MNRRRKLNIKSVILFLYTWLCVGFPMGLWVLLAGPSRWLAEYAHNSGMNHLEENVWGKLIIVGYIIVSFFLALVFFNIVKRTRMRFLKLGIPVILGLVFLFSVFVFSFHPQWLIAHSSSGTNEHKGSGILQTSGEMEFVFGSYPTEEMMDSLKEQGFDAIISLLHEMVVPAEPALLKKETEIGEKIGLRIINIPMLPWISGNEKALEQIKQLATSGKGRYYVHCYLGRDRVNVFKSLVEKYGVKAQAGQAFAPRKLDELPQMERGKVFQLEDGVFLTPYPTDEEFFAYILNGYFNTVISLLDSTLNENKSWTDKEKEIMKEYEVDYFSFPCSNFSDQETLERLKILVSEKKKPIVIHAFKTDDPSSEYIVNHY